MRRVLRPSRSRRSSQVVKQPRTTKPPTIRNGTSENPNGVTSCPLTVSASIGLIQPHVLLFRIPNTIRPKRDGRERGADVIQLRWVFGLARSLHALVDEQHRDHDHDLADEDVPPAERRRHPAADQRAGCDRRARGPADHPVGERTVLALVVRGDQRRDRRDHQHRAEPLDPRPADQQHGEVRAERRDQRAEPVHRQADGKDAVTPEDVAELGADEHERRHHERVHRDRALHPGHRRVQIRHESARSRRSSRSSRAP